MNAVEEEGVTMAEQDLATSPAHTTRDRLVEAISTHGPITARQLAERFGLTSAEIGRASCRERV